MKVLYAIQGTGNGHLSRARDIIPILDKKVSLDVLVSGSEADIVLPYPVKYKLHGLSFAFGKNGAVDIGKTIRKSRIHKLIEEIRTLPVNDYNLVINDFEPVSAWAAKLHGVECIGLSHQSAVLNKHAPQPKELGFWGKLILKYYAPNYKAYGFHFKHYGSHIFTPVIRTEVRNVVISSGRHFTVYLPAYDNRRIIQILKCFPYSNWDVFTKHGSHSFKEDNVTISPISNDAFIHSMASSAGVLCGAGFETPAEALYLGKKLMVIPMSNQLEQLCNATCLKQMGVPVIDQLNEAAIPTIKAWLNNNSVVHVNYPNNLESLIDKLLTEYAESHFCSGVFAH